MPRRRLFDLVHEAFRALHYSRRTEESYVHWMRRFIFFHGNRHPDTLGEPEVTAFLNHLAADRNVAASTQNQALAALLFLYKHVLRKDLALLDGLVRARRPARPGGAAARRVCGRDLTLRRCACAPCALAGSRRAARGRQSASRR